MWTPWSCRAGVSAMLNLNAGARRWAKAFIALGIVSGDHVGLLFNTCTSFVDALFGAAMAGAAVVPMLAELVVEAGSRAPAGG